MITSPRALQELLQKQVLSSSPTARRRAETDVFHSGRQ